jgi:hypothetical protein
MNKIQPEDYLERTESAPPFRIHIISYRLGDEYYCSVDNIDPGAVITRSRGSTRKEAELRAVTRAKDRLGRTHVQESIYGW